MSKIDQGRSDLFLVRLWSQQGIDGDPEWYGKVQHVVSGAAHTFHGCPELVQVLLGMAPVEESDNTSKGETANGS